MKLSVSIPDVEVDYIDELARSGRFASRSAAIHAAIRVFRAHDLGDEYEAAWEEWKLSGEADIWETATGDGLREGRS